MKRIIMMWLVSYFLLACSGSGSDSQEYKYVNDEQTLIELEAAFERKDKTSTIAILNSVNRLEEKKELEAKILIKALQCETNLCLEMALSSGIDPNTYNASLKRNIIFRALGPTKLDHLRTLLNFDVDINVKDSNSMTLLMTSIMLSQYKTALMLIENGADIKALDKNGNTALFFLEYTVSSEDTVADPVYVKLKEHLQY